MNSYILLLSIPVNVNVCVGRKCLKVIHFNFPLFHLKMFQVTLLCYPILFVCINNFNLKIKHCLTVKVLLGSVFWFFMQLAETK